MARDLVRIIRSLQESAVNRCRERLDEAASRAKDLIDRGDGKEPESSKREEDYGVTSILKRKHGL